MPNRFVEKLRGFADLTAAEVSALEQATARSKTYAPRTDLIREGDEPGPVLVMLDGWAYRYKVLPTGSRQIMAFMMPGDACDLHISLLDEMDHSIQTVEQAEVATISRSTMDRLMESPGIAKAMYIAQLVDEGTLRAWIVSLGRRSSTERAAHLLLELYIRAVNVGAAEAGAMKLPLRQTVLADALGVTSVHINRVLQTLRKSDIVVLGRGALHIKDAAGLARLSGWDDSYLHRRIRRPGRK